MNLQAANNGYSVKNVKSFIGNEGYGYNADLYRNGKKIAFVMDMADGGMVDFDWVDPRESDILDQYVKTLPKLKSDIKGLDDIEVDADIFMGRLVDAYEIDKKLKRQCKAKLLFTLKGDAPDGYRYISRPDSPEVRAHVEKKYPGQVKEYVNDRYK